MNNYNNNITDEEKKEFINKNIHLNNTYNKDLHLDNKYNNDLQTILYKFHKFVKCLYIICSLLTIIQGIGIILYF